jgi:hypothetical protein
MSLKYSTLEHLCVAGLFGLPGHSDISGLSVPLTGLSEPNPDPARNWYSLGGGMGWRMKEHAKIFQISDSYENLFINEELYHYTSARYCRRLTDAELGYKMYIDNTNDRVIMLPYNVSTTLTVVLPPGLERGLALRDANLTELKVYNSWSGICADADKIRAFITGVSARPTFPNSPNVGGYVPGTSLPDPFVKGATGSVYMVIRVYNGGYDNGTYGIDTYDWDNPGVLPADSSTQVGTYKTRVVGEYVWTTENLKLKYRDLWSLAYNQINITQALLDAKFASIGLTAPSVSDYINKCGTWITELPECQSFRNDFKFYDVAGGVEQAGWDLPDEAAILQLLGQMPYVPDPNPGDNGYPPAGTATNTGVDAVTISTIKVEDAKVMGIDSVSISKTKAEDNKAMGVDSVTIKKQRAGMNYYGCV